MDSLTNSVDPNERMWDLKRVLLFSKRTALFSGEDAHFGLVIWTSDPSKCNGLPPGGGGGGTQIFSVYVGSNPASTVNPPKKNSAISSTPKKYFKF